MASLNSRPCFTRGRICSTHSSEICWTRFLPSTVKVSDHIGWPAPSAHQQLGFPQRRCVSAREPGRASAGICRPRSKECLRCRKRAAGSPLALSHDFICLYYYRQKGNVKKLLSLGEFAQGANADIFNPYVTLRVWTGSLGRVPRAPWKPERAEPALSGKRNRLETGHYRNEE